jgi:glutamate synthase (NADPH/NADH) small chain
MPAFRASSFAGVHDAMPYLVQQNRRVGRENIDSVGWPSAPIMAGGKHVVVVGGGDTASDCVGTAFRQGAVRVTQLDIRPQPPEKEDKLAVWPLLGHQDAHFFLAGRRCRTRIPGRNA